MNGGGKSDGPVVPAKRSNNVGDAAAEVVDGRGSAKGNKDPVTSQLPGHLDRNAGVDRELHPAQVGKLPEQEMTHRRRSSARLSLRVNQ